MYTIRITYPVSIAESAHWFTTAETLDEARRECEHGADHFFGEGSVLERGQVVAISNCGAPCESPRALVKRPKSTGR